MGVILPDIAQEVIDRMRADVKAFLPNSNPSLKESLIGAETNGTARRIFDVYYQLKELTKQLFPFQAVGEYLELWSDTKRLTQLPSTASAGSITITGVVSSVIPIGTVYTVGSLEYTTDAEATITANQFSVDTLTSSGGLALCVTDDDHEFATGKTVTMAGANETDYNGDFVINVTASNAFTYPVSGTPTSPATGTITASMDSATAQVTADLTTAEEGGAETNQDGGVELTLQSSIAGVDSTAATQFEGLQGGRDAETDDEFRVRVLERWQKPITNFNSNNIERIAKSVDGVTRVWVDEVTPAAGQVTIYFTRDNDDDIIPSAAEVAEVRTEILKAKQAHTIDADVITPIIGAVPIDITISNVEPNTLSMRKAINNTIDSFYRGSMDKGEDHDPEKLRGAIFQTYDVQGGEKIVGFTLDAPTAVQPVTSAQIATKGTVVINN